MMKNKQNNQIYAESIQYLEQAPWDKINRHLVKKILTEFRHERILSIELIDESENLYLFSLPELSIEYQFKAIPYFLNHLEIDANSIVKKKQGKVQAIDAKKLILEIRNQLEISDKLLPIYLDEIAATLSSRAYKEVTPRPSAKELLKADFQTIESSMDEGHPVFVANNGRIGFDSIDYLLFAPECAHLSQLIWIAVNKNRTVFSHHTSLNYETLIQKELSSELINKFQEKLDSLSVNSEDYYWMPVHEWQWREKITTRYAGEIASQDIIYLGVGEDSYQPQQSIRTFFNHSHPEKYYVKMSLSILNMGFMRGLSPYYMSGTPEINEWLEELIGQDSLLKEYDFRLLKEMAAIGFKDLLMEEAIKESIPQKKMLSALWRESPIHKISQQQSIKSMTSLLHIDKHGNSFLNELILASNLSTERWVEKFLQAYFLPLLHCFFKYDLLFMPHAENLILIFENNIPVGAFMKDIAEEIGIVNSDIKIPESISRIKYQMTESTKLNYFFLDIFDSIFRFIIPILDRDLGFKEIEFWTLVGNLIETHQENHPEFKEKYQRYNLFIEFFELNALNRLQIRNNIQMLDLLDQESSYQFVGKLKNPLFLAKFGN
ncbi:IucA/IucC family siderophore biosynthesis protein [Neisseriaceae bacterium PsAf]|nr:IucA/IucC family siderophore biosynthesis protein [Neisseriaceae bacterium PsAf]